MLIDRGGVPIFALEAGAGEPALVLVHGNAADHTVWHRQIARFSRERRVVAVDLRGHGRSGKDPERRYTQDTFVGDVTATLDVLGIRSAILVGWSMGGSVVARIAGERPDLVTAVVLVDNNLAAASAELGLDLGPYAPELLFRGLAEDFAGRGLRAFVDAWFPESGPEIDFLKEWLWHIGMQASREVVVGIRTVGMKEDRSEWFRRLAVPTLVLQGGASRLGGRRVGEHLARLIPGAELHVFDGHGQALILTAPEEFDRVLGDFVARVAVGRAGSK